MTRPHLERYSQLSLTEVTFVPYIWTPFILMTQRLPSWIVCIGTLYLFSSEFTVYLVNTGMQTFTYSEYLSIAMAKVWSGKADLPSTTELWRRYDKVVKDRGGYGKQFQFLGAERTKGRFKKFLHSLILSWNSNSAAALRFFISWLNADAVKYGGKQVSLYLHFKCFLNEADMSCYRLDWRCSRVRIFIVRFTYS